MGKSHQVGSIVYGGSVGMATTARMSSILDRLRLEIGR